jgi:hypothetical protein
MHTDEGYISLYKTRLTYVGPPDGLAKKKDITWVEIHRLHVRDANECRKLLTHMKLLSKIITSLNERRLGDNLGYIAYTGGRTNTCNSFTSLNPLNKIGERTTKETWGPYSWFPKCC